MTDPVREQILGYLLGALDVSERAEVVERLRTDPRYQQELATAQRRLGHLDPAGHAAAPPPGLARRTCDFVFAHTARIREAAKRVRTMTPCSATPHAGQRMSWLDSAIAAVVIVVAGLAVLPAIYGSRFQARVITCQDNLRQLGLALTGYSEHHQDTFPAIPAEGKLAAAGIYAPTLIREGYLTQSDRVLCPESPEAGAAESRQYPVPTIEELQVACEQEVARLRDQMGGSYGYNLGHLENGQLVPTRNLARADFAILADAPSSTLPGRQSPNHGGQGQNVLYEDGHVQFEPTSQPPGSDDIFVNDAHLVAPGLNRHDAVIAPSGTAPIIFVNNR